MIGGSVQYAVGLVDKMSGPAHAASSSVSSLTKQLRIARAEVAQFQRLKVGAKEFGSSGDFLRFSDSARQARERVYQLEKQTESLSGAIGGSDKPLSLVARFGPLIAGLTAVSAVAIGVGGAWTSLAGKVIHAANAERTFQRETRAAFTALGGSDAIGAQTFEMVDSLSKRLPVARAQLVDWTKALQSAGITDVGVVRRGLGGLASAQAVGGEGGAEQLLSTIRRVQEAIQTNHGLRLADRQLASLAKTGANVDDVARELGISTQVLQQRLKAGTEDAGAFGNALLEAVTKKGRGPLQAMWFDIDKLEKKGEEFASRLLRNVDMSPVTESLDRMVHLLDDSTAAGKDLETGLRKGTSGAAKLFGEISDAVQITYLRVAAFGLRADTALLPFERALHRITKYIDLVRVGFDFLTFGAYSKAINPIGATPKPTAAGDSAKQTLYTATAAVARARVTGAMKGEELQAAGDRLSGSLAAGIRQGLITHEEAVKLQGIALGKAAIEGVEKGTDSHSPSRAAFRIGGFVGLGLAGGIRSSGPSVDRAAVFLGEQATRTSLYTRSERGRGGECSGGGRGGGVHIGRVEANITAPSGVTDASEITVWGLSVALEREQLMGGG